MAVNCFPFTITQSVTLAVVSWVVYTLLNKWLIARAFDKWAKQEGCGEMPRIPNKLPWGLERYRILFTDLKKLDYLEDIISARQRMMKCHTYRMTGAFGPLVSTTDPQNIQTIMSTKFNNFDLGPARHKTFQPLIGNGIFTAERDTWPHYRHQLRPVFAREQISDLESTNKHMKILFKALPQENALGWVEEADLAPLIFRLMMDISTEFLLGESVDSQTRAIHMQDSQNKSDAEGDMHFTDAVNYCQVHLGKLVRYKGISWFLDNKKFHQATQTIKDFTKPFIRKALQYNPHQKPPLEPGRKEKVIFINEVAQETRDPIELRDQVLHVLLAGRDTTSALLCFAILLMARHPEEFIKVREAVISRFGTESQPKEALTHASMRLCKPLLHLLNESLRLYPLVAINSRFAACDTILPTGGGPNRDQPVAVKKGEQVEFSMFVLHRRKDIWGEDADEFRPTRWDTVKLGGWTFLPFGGGPRICIGQQLAMNEVCFILIRLLQKFDRIEALDTAYPIKKGMTFTLSPADGVPVKMHRARD